MKISLPQAVMAFCQAHKALQNHYASSGFDFTLDGKLVGDIAEAVAVEAFDLIRCERRTPGVDAHTRSGVPVQVKATGSSKSGPAFTPGKGTAEHLIFMQLNFEQGYAEIIYNGREKPVRALLPAGFAGTYRIRLSKIRGLLPTPELDQLRPVCRSSS